MPNGDGYDGQDETRMLYDELRYPGRILPPRAQDLASSAPGWSRLARNTPLGQKSNLFYNAEADEQDRPCQILQIPGNEGTDLDATQIQLVLAPPLAIPKDARELDGVNVANATGEMGNATMGAFGDYPGTTPARPIIWPPLIYVVEWGVGGTKCKAEIDAVNGAAVNLTASFVRVFGAVAPDGALNAPGTTGIYTLAAFVGPGYPRTGSAQRTVFVGEWLDTEESDAFATPEFAKDVTVSASTPGVVVAAYVTFYQAPDKSFPIASYYVSGNQPGPFRVPNAGAYFTVTNAMGQAAEFAACFGLSI